MRSWIEITNKKPKHKQPVFYYFKYTGVHAGYYKETEIPEEAFNQKGIFMDCFYGDSGFLCDDVTHWMPREEGDKLPEKPVICIGENNEQ
jgi:hypothetical protein